MDAASIKYVLEQLDVKVVATNANGWICAFCPFAEFTHETGRDRNPDFYVKTDRKKLSGFHCFACHEHGRMSTLVKKLEHYRNEDYGNLSQECEMMEIPDDFGDFEEQPDIEVDPDPLDKAVYMGMYPKAWEDQFAVDYLWDRGITEETTELLQLLYDPEECRILFPVFDHRENFYGFSGRSVLTKEEIVEENERRAKAGLYVRYSKVQDYGGLPKAHLLLGEQLIDKTKPLQLLEGLFAFAHMVQIGAREFLNPVATFGSKVTKHQKSILIDIGLATYLWYDNDKAGDEGLYGPMNKDGGFKGGGAIDLLKPHIPLFLPMWPDDPPIDDPDELTIEHVKEMMLDAQSVE